LNSTTEATYTFKDDIRANTKKDYLWLQVRDLPYFRAFLRAVEARVYPTLDLPGPTLDLGCGDGHFATIAFDRKLEAGIDPWTGPVHQAMGRGGYECVLQGSGDQLPFEDGHFNSAISNSVLEHIPDLDPVLKEMARVLKPGAPFVFCVPNHQFLANLSVSNFFDRIGLRFLGNAYRAFFNRISRHQHCDSPEVWEARLEKAGFRIEKWWHYFSPQALHTLEWGHYFGLPALICHFLFRRWILVPTRWNLALAMAIVRPFYEEEIVQKQGAYTFYITRKI
jgi:SAM-dependent methyltransferase